MKKLVYLGSFLFSFIAFGQYMSIGKDTLTLAEFKKDYDQSLKSYGVEASLKTAQDYYLFQQLAEEKKVDTTAFFRQRMASKLNELHEQYFFEPQKVQELTQQYVSDNRQEREILVFSLEKTPGDPTDYKKVYNEVVSGKLSMEDAIKTYVKKEVRPMFIKAGTINPIVFKEIVALSPGRYTRLEENSRTVTFIKLLSVRPSLGYMIFGSLSYPNDANAAKMKSDIFADLKSGKPFNEITAKYGTTPNEKNAGGAVMGSPVLPAAVYNALKGKKAGEYTLEPVLVENRYFVFYIYDLAPYQLTEDNKSFFTSEMLSSNYSQLLEDRLIAELEASKDFVKTSDYGVVSSSYNAFKNFNKPTAVLLSYKGSPLTYQRLKSEVDQQYKDLDQVNEAQWKVLLDLRVKNFLFEEYSKAFFARKEVSEAIESEKKMAYSQYIYSDFLKTIVDSSAENISRYYQLNKNKFLWEEMAEGRVAVVSDSKETAKVKSTIADPKKWEGLKNQYKNKLNKEGKVLVSFQEGEMNKDAEIFTTYNVPFAKGVYQTQMGGRDVVISIDQILPRSQMTLEESKSDVVALLTEDALKKLLENQRAKTHIVVQPAFRADLEKNFKK